MAQQGPDDRNRRFSLLQNTAEDAIELCRIAFGSCHHRVIELEPRRVAYRKPRVLEFDTSSIAGVKRQFFELGAGQQAITPEMFDEKQRGVTAGSDLMLGEGIADHCRQIARRIRIAADSRAAACRLEDAAKGRTRGQVASLGHNESIARCVLKKLPE